MQVITEQGFLAEMKIQNEIAEIKSQVSWLSNLSPEALAAFLAAKKGSL